MTIPISSKDRADLLQALDDCACFRFRKVSRLVTQIYDEALQPTGFRSTQLVILLALIEEDDIAHAKLARQLAVSPSSLTRALRPLERRNLLEIAASEGRRNTIKLTEDGIAAAIAAAPYWQRAHDEVMAHFADGEWADLSKRLDGLADSLRRR